MCRLMAMTDTTINPAMKRLFMNQLLLLSNAEKQRDGSGVSDGRAVFKSNKPYMNYGLDLLRGLDPHSIWLGHVRAASRDTDITPWESHPFHFTLPDGRELIAAHNGGITGMPKSSRDEPNVDSYQAFKMLIVTASHGLTPDTINEWTDKFGISSEWTFMFLLDRQLTVVRGIRPMHYITMNGGLVLNTSSDVLVTFKEWVHEFWRDKYVFGQVTPIKEYQMLTVGENDQTVTLKPILPSASVPFYSDVYYRKLPGKQAELVKE